MVQLCIRPDFTFYDGNADCYALWHDHPVYDGLLGESGTQPHPSAVADDLDYFDWGIWGVRYEQDAVSYVWRDIRRRVLLVEFWLLLSDQQGQHGGGRCETGCHYGNVPHRRLCGGCGLLRLYIECGILGMDAGAGENHKERLYPVCAVSVYGSCHTIYDRLGGVSMVKKKMHLLQLLLVMLMVVSVLMSVGVVLLRDEQGKQARLLQRAGEFYEDKLYMRAISTYQEAVDRYNTPDNPAIESSILQIYKEAGKMKIYYDLIEARIEEKKAQKEEYQELAQHYVDEGRITSAIEILKSGIQQYDDAAMRELYEQIRYEVSGRNTDIAEVKYPKSGWYIPYFDGSLWGYMDSSGSVVLEPKYEEALAFSGNYAVVKIDGVYTLINASGDWYAVDKLGLEAVTGAAGSFIIGKKNGKYGIYTNTFSEVTGAVYDGAVISSNGLCFVKQQGKWGLITSSGEAVLDFVYDDVVQNSCGEAYASGYAVVKDASGYFIIDEKGVQLGESRYADAKGMEGGLLAVADSRGRWGFTDGVSETVIDYQYEDAYSFSCSVAAVKRGNQWGYINTSNAFVIELQYEDAMPFSQGKGIVKSMGQAEVLTLRYYEYF